MADQSISRRDFVLGGMAAAAAIVVGDKLFFPIGDAAADGEGAQYGFWCDTSKNDDFSECVQACRLANGLSDDDPDLCEVHQYMTKYGRYRYVFVSCMHCSDPSCMQVCPARAISKREEDGIVVVDQKRCIGCKYCNTACPFDVPKYNKGGMVKCDCCISANGGKPACVEALASGALHFGSIEDLIRESGGRAMQITGPSGPSYLLS